MKNNFNETVERFIVKTEDVRDMRGSRLNLDELEVDYDKTLGNLKFFNFIDEKKEVDNLGNETGKILEYRYTVVSDLGFNFPVRVPAEVGKLEFNLFEEVELVNPVFIPYANDSGSGFSVLVDNIVKKAAKVQQGQGQLNKDKDKEGK